MNTTKTEKMPTFSIKHTGEHYTILRPLSKNLMPELRLLNEKVIADDFESDAKTKETNGDTRHWIFEPKHSRFLSHMIEVARTEYQKRVPAKDPDIVLMLNSVTPANCPGGSGDGWHVDSVRPQYKLFCYLTDCLEPSLGAFCLLKHNSKVASQAAVLLNRFAKGSKRFSAETITRLKRQGFVEAPVLLPAGQPFFVRTNQPHRGLPITHGRRTMLTAYIYGNGLPKGVREKIGLFSNEDA